MMSGLEVLLVLLQGDDMRIDDYSNRLYVDGCVVHETLEARWQVLVEELRGKL